VLVIVGPNNSGKSATLRAIRDKLKMSFHSPVLPIVHFKKIGTLKDIISLLDIIARKNPTSPFNNQQYNVFGVNLYINNINGFWSGNASGLEDGARVFCHFLTADERLQASNPPNNIAVLRDAPSHPIHFLQRDDREEKRIGDMFKQAFGVDISINRNAGSQVPLVVGNRPIPISGQDRLSYEYTQTLAQLPELQTQGDGMRSFAGVLLATSVGRESIILIDEPEAFLHPPQARLLGRMLVANKPSDRQLFIATHSGDILRGLLDTNRENLRVIRIRRSGDINVVRQLNKTRLAEIWSDSLLRYSSILDGLFHEKVVLCESDSDCRFYSAILDAVVEAKGADTQKQDCMFTHCGGKSRLPMVIRALKELDVPLVCITDFDILNNEHPLREIAESAGCNWESISSVWREVKNAIESKKPELSSSEVGNEIKTIIEGIKEPMFPASAKQRIQDVLRRSSPWSTAKSVGKSFVPQGQPTQSYNRLIEILKNHGVFVVEVGEVEGFARSVAGHGPSWASDVLNKNLKDDSELRQAREFVAEIAGIR
jgi:AAA domain, putative AbiEii toxin, Type IV TA system